MHRKMSARRCAAFLKALRESGNVTVAAERACVSRSWVVKRRGEDPGFDADCREAVASASARLGAEGCNRVAAKGWGTLDGAELVVRGSNRRGVQIARARAHSWTPKVEKRFLEVLAATCNVRAAYTAAGMSKGSAYAHRKRWPAFARKWQAAEDAGFWRLEVELLERGENLLSSKALPPDAPMPRMTVQEALQLMRLHQSQVRGTGRAPGRWTRPRTLEEVKPGILRAFSVIARRRGLL